MNSRAADKTPVKLWGVIPAAGIGSRMQADCPKQYLPLAGKTLIEKTLERLLAIPQIQRLVVALNPDDHVWPKLSLSQHKKIVTVAGGQERADSVLNALLSLQGIAADNDWILVHDAARPCVSLASIEKLLNACAEHPLGGILGVPVSDTIKQVKDKSVITKTVDRSVLWQAQTPQLFRYGILLKALKAAVEVGFLVTDESSAVEVMLKKPLGDEVSELLPLMVEGNSDNIKITRPEDLPLAELILQRQDSQKN